MVGNTVIRENIARIIYLQFNCTLRKGICFSRIFQPNASHRLDWHIIPATAVDVNKSWGMEDFQMVAFAFQFQCILFLFTFLLDKFQHRCVTDDQLAIRDWVGRIPCGAIPDLVMNILSGKAVNQVEVPSIDLHLQMGRSIFQEMQGLRYKKSFYKFMNNIVHRELRRAFKHITVVADEIGSNEYISFFQIPLSPAHFVIGKDSYTKKRFVQLFV